ncbi:N-acetylmuramoyl-L-alanine amidase [Edaphobacter aggregans]
MQAKAKGSSGQRRVAEMSPWEQATQGREALEAIPDGSRTKADYARAMDGYRAIYHETPQSQYAAASVNAVAELLAEQGRGLQDAKSLKAAVGQYEFLRTQYPGSSLRVGALLAEAQIYENDLHDATAAKEKYALLVKQYPRSSQAEEARAGLDSLEQGTGSREEGIADKQQRPGQSAAAASAEDKAGASSFAPMPVTRSAGLPAAQNRAAVVGPSAGDSAAASSAKVASGNTSNDADAAERRGTSNPMDEASDGAEQNAVVGLSHVAKNAGGKRKGFAQVTGIRHWSTPNYTRVAIDLGDDVTYEAARVPHPDRIYFDLHGTRLAQELVGKSFAVTDDGFLKKIRAAQFSNDVTRVVLDVNDVTEYSAFLLPNPYRLIIDIHGGTPLQAGASKDQTAGSQATNADEVPAPRTAAAGKTAPGRPVPNTVATRNASTAIDVAALSDQPGKVEATSVPTSRPIAAVVPETGGREEGVGSSKQTADVAATPTAGSGSSLSSRKGKKGAAVVDPAAPARAAVPTADGETSLVRALGLKIGRIVIDAGHGGHDSGTLGVDGLEEKDVVLDVALRLGKILHDRLGAEIIYTRSDDTFIPLETRTAIANKSQADLFLSIHANSSSDASARGVETYYLNFTSQPDALEVAARENAVSDQSIHQLSDLVKKIALKEKIDESREFASDVETSLYGGLQKGNAGLKNRGVKKAPFVVLIGANMPSILAEISFVTNPKDARQLRQTDYRQRVAESLYKGVAKYAGGLSGAKVSSERASNDK